MDRTRLKPLHGTTGASASDVYPVDADTGAKAQEAQKYFFFQNVSDTDMWLAIGEGETAAANVGILVPANGGYWESQVVVPIGRVSVWCASTGKHYSCYIG